MKRCNGIIDISSGAASRCENHCEGNTDYCASHNRANRKSEERYRANQEKRAQLKEKVKIKNNQPRPKVNKVSPKRKEENKLYSELRPIFLLEHPDCELKLIGCEGASVEVHHTESGSNKAKSLNIVSTWKAACGHCHRYLHDKLSAKEARELGLKI